MPVAWCIADTYGLQDCRTEIADGGELGVFIDFFFGAFLEAFGLLAIVTSRQTSAVSCAVLPALSLALLTARTPCRRCAPRC